MLTALALALAQTAQAEGLSDSAWQPNEINGTPFASLSDTFIQFDQDGRYFGNAGCNSMRGRFVTNENDMLLSPAAVTMMACPDEIATQERAFLSALMAARGFDHTETELSFVDRNGAIIIRLTRRSAN